jgi:hypothetical protein
MFENRLVCQVAGLANQQGLEPFERRRLGCLLRIQDLLPDTDYDSGRARMLARDGLSPGAYYDRDRLSRRITPGSVLVRWLFLTTLHRGAFLGRTGLIRLVIHEWRYGDVWGKQRRIISALECRLKEAMDDLSFVGNADTPSVPPVRHRRLSSK